MYVILRKIISYLLTILLHIIFILVYKGVKSAHIMILALIVVRIQHNFGGCAIPKKIGCRVYTHTS